MCALSDSWHDWMFIFFRSVYLKGLHECCVDVFMGGVVCSIVEFVERNRLKRSGCCCSINNQKKSRQGVRQGTCLLSMQTNDSRTIQNVDGFFNKVGNLPEEKLFCLSYNANYADSLELY
jgi:hypothetical protein